MSTSVGSIHYDLSLDTTKFDAAAAKVSSGLQGVGNKMQDVGGSMMSAGAKLSIFSVAAVLTGKTFVDLAADLQTTQQRMGALAGSTENAKKIMGELYNYVLGKPITFPEASKAATTLLGYGVASNKVVDAMKTLSAFTIVNGADMQQLALAYGQVNAKGRLAGQEIIQLTNNFVPVSDVIAKHFNVSLQDAMKLMEDGKVTAADFNAAMAEFIPQSKIAEMSNTFQNRMISLQGSLRSLGLELLGVRVDPQLGLVIEEGGLFDTFSKMLPKIADGLKSIKNAFKSLSPEMKQLVLGFTLFMVVLGPVLIVFGAIISAIGTVVGAIGTIGSIFGTVAGAIGTAFSAIAAIVGAPVLVVAAVVAAIVALGVIIFIFRDQIWNFFTQTIPQAIGAAMNWFGTLPGIIGNAIMGALNWIAKLPENIAFALGWMVGRFVLFVTSDLPNFIGGIASWFSQLPSRVGNAMIGMYNTITGWFNNARNVAGNVAQGLVNWVGNVFNSLPGIASNVISQIVGFFAGLPGRALGALGNFAGQIMDRLRSIAGAAWEGFKKGLGIRSPSYIEKAFMAISDQASSTVDDMKYTMSSLASMASTNLRNNIGVNYSASLNGVPTSSTSNAVTTNLYGSINISSEVDADAFLARLTRNQETALRGAALPVGGRA